MKQAPNILLVVADQMHADWLGCAGRFPVRTPHLDAFAAPGMRFERAYCQNPICTPSRVSLLSAQYPHNHGYYGLGGPSHSKLNNLFRHTRKSGYRTAAFGKLHLPHQPHNWIADDVDAFGDSYETAAGEIGRSDFLDGLERDGLRELEDSWHNRWNYGKNAISIDATCSRLPYERTQERWAADRAIDFIQADASRPFCVEVCFQKPHHPLLPQQAFWDLYEDLRELPPHWDTEPTGRPAPFRHRWHEWRKYAWDYGHPGESFAAAVLRCWRGTLACVSQIDDVFGRLLAALETTGQADNTIIVFTSDHGAYHGLFGQMEKAPGICSEAVCRVPLIVRAPGIAPAAPTSQGFVELIDVVPTCLALAGLPAMEDADGEDFSKLLRGRESPRTCAVTENPLGRSLRWDQWRLVHYPEGQLPDAPYGELYHLGNDPDEQRNLYHDPAHREVVAEGTARLLDHLITRTRTTTIHRANEHTPPFPGCVAGDGRAPRALQPAFDPHRLPEYL